MNDSREELMALICNSFEAQRVKELEKYIDNNEDIRSKFSHLKELQKQMVNAKHFELINTYSDYKKQYEKSMDELLDEPFLEEYFDVLESLHNTLIMVCNIIEDVLNESLL